MQPDTQPFGIIALASAHGEEVRENNWWAQDIVDKWGESFRKKYASPPPMQTLPEGARLVTEAMIKLRNDPFQGAQRRHRMLPGQRSSHLEVQAAQRALQTFDIDPGEIKLILAYSNVPDYLMVPNASLLHDKLGLSRNTMSVSLDTACNSFGTQLELAHGFLRAQGGKALLIQSNAAAQVIDDSAPYAPWFGDAATAVVLGETDSGGLMGSRHYTNGSIHDGLVCNVRDKRWFDVGRTELYIENPNSARAMFFSIPEVCDEVVSGALDQAKLRKSDIDFYAAHQGTAWLRSVTQEYMGLPNARSLDTFADLASLSASNVPVVLERASRAGQLKRGDTVAIFCAGSGITASGYILQWAI